MPIFQQETVANLQKMPVADDRQALKTRLERVDRVHGFLNQVFVGFRHFRRAFHIQHGEKLIANGENVIGANEEDCCRRGEAPRLDDIDLPKAQGAEKDESFIGPNSDVSELVLISFFATD